MRSVTLKLLSLPFLLLTAAAMGQDGTSTAAAGRTKYLGELGIIPASREVAVDEIVNYHRHGIGRPKAGEAVGMDVRWGNDRVSPRGEAVLQVGFSTALANDRQQLRPLNLSLVIDKSGSMSDADKMSRVKKALQVFVSQLRADDVLSIVVFDTKAKVLLPARKVGERGALREIIQSIEPGGSTNIHEGLMLGYHEALKNQSKEVTNRVILLTDGIANQGVTEPESIAKDSLGFNNKGIDLSTIGVGLDLNKDLLRQLAKSGRGLFHFVADAQDIEKVFLNEVQSLVSPVATDPNVVIEYDSGLNLVHTYGYEPKIHGGKVTVKLDNMNSGMTQVVLLRFQDRARSDGNLGVNVRLSYYDLERKQQVVKTERVVLKVGESGSHEMLLDNEVGKNYTIAVLAQAIRDMAAACEAEKLGDAERIVTTAIAMAHKRYPTMEDADIKRNLLIAQKYQEVLRKRDVGRDKR